MPRHNVRQNTLIAPAVRIIQQVRVQGQLCEIAFDWIARTAFTLTTSEMLSLISAHNSNSDVELLDCLSDQAVVENQVAISLTDASVPTVNLPRSVLNVGTAGVHNLPLEMSATLAKYTPLRGQHGRGRMSMPAVPVSFTTPATDPNLLNAAGITAYGAYIAKLVGTLTTATPKVWDPAVTERPVTPDIITSRGGIINLMIVRPVLGTARRRKEGRGV